MSSLMGFNVYKTETYSAEGVSYTVKFSKSCDSQEHCLFVTNNSNGKQAHYNYSNDAAHDFELYNAQELESVVLQIIKGDIADKIV